MWGCLGAVPRGGSVHICAERTEPAWDAEPGQTRLRGLRTGPGPGPGSGCRQPSERRSSRAGRVAAAVRSVYSLKVTCSDQHSVISAKPLTGPLIFTVIMLFIMESFSIHVDIICNSIVI